MTYWEGLFIHKTPYLLTQAFCLMRNIGHQQHSANTPNSGLSSSVPSRGDRFWAFLSWCLYAMCSWIFPLFSLTVWIPGQSTDSCRWKSGAYGVLLESFSMFPVLRGHWFNLCWNSWFWWIFQCLWSSKLSWESGRQFLLCLFLLSHVSVPPCVSTMLPIGKLANFFFEGLSCYCDWAVTGVLHPCDLCLAIIDVQTHSGWCWFQASSFVLRLCTAVGQECQVIGKVKVIKFS